MPMAQEMQSVVVPKKQTVKALTADEVDRLNSEWLDRQMDTEQDFHFDI